MVADPIVPSAVLAELRAIASAGLTQRADLYRPILPAPAAGGVVRPTYGAVFAALPCRLVLAARPTSRVVADGLTAVADWRFHAPIGADVRAGDVLMVRDQYGTALRIVTVLDVPPATHAVTLQVPCTDTPSAVAAAVRALAGT